jgi:Galactose oxidase, central domain
VPGARWGHTAVAYNGALYIFGGSMPGECFDEVTVICVPATSVTV